jgi:hypothetical protein
VPVVEVAVELDTRNPDPLGGEADDSAGVDDLVDADVLIEDAPEVALARARLDVDCQDLQVVSPPLLR